MGIDRWLLTISLKYPLGNCNDPIRHDLEFKLLAPIDTSFLRSTPLHDYPAVSVRADPLPPGESVRISLILVL